MSIVFYRLVDNEDGVAEMVPHLQGEYVKRTDYQRHISGLLRNRELALNSEIEKEYNTNTFQREW